MSDAFFAADVFDAPQIADVRKLAAHRARPEILQQHILEPFLEVFVRRREFVKSRHRRRRQLDYLDSAKRFRRPSCPAPDRSSD